MKLAAGGHVLVDEGVEFAVFGRGAVGLGDDVGVVEVSVVRRLRSGRRRR